MEKNKMRRNIILIFSICAMLVSISVLTVSAVKPVQKIKLVEKNPSDWSVIEDGAWGEFIINENNAHYVFNAHGLEAGVGYTLVAYVENWPNAVAIGESTVNCYGDFHLNGYVPDLPTYTYTSGEYDGQTGTKIWLVHTADFVGGTLAWSPSGWLWETSLLI